MKNLFRLSLLAGVIACSAQNPVGVDDGTSQRLDASVGAEIIITLQTIGPGEFASPPEISSSNLRFIDVSQAAVVVPAGPTQRFRFKAVAPGRAVITFRHTFQNRVVEDTVDVR